MKFKYSHFANLNLTKKPAEIYSSAGFVASTGIEPVSKV